MMNREISEHLLNIGQGKNAIFGAAIINFAAAIALFILAGPTVGVISLGLACMLLLCYFMVVNGIKAGYIIALVIYAINTLGLLFLAIDRSFNLIGVVISVLFIIAFAKGSAAQRKVPKDVDVAASLTAFKNTTRQAKKGKTFNAKAQREAIKNKTFEMEIIYKDM